RQERVQLRAGPPRHPHRPGQRRRHADQADLARVPAAVLSHASHRPGGVAHGIGRAPLRSGFRSRFQYDRSICWTYPQEARGRLYSDRPGTGLSPDPAGLMAVVAKPESGPGRLRGRFFRLIGANSLARRLFVSATASIVVILVATGIVLSS